MGNELFKSDHPRLLKLILSYGLYLAHQPINVLNKDIISCYEHLLLGLWTIIRLLGSLRCLGDGVIQWGVLHLLGRFRLLARHWSLLWYCGSLLNLLCTSFNFFHLLSSLFLYSFFLWLLSILLIWLWNVDFIVDFELSLGLWLNAPHNFISI